MFKNVYYDKKQSQIHLWEQVNGENLYSINDWVPYVYIPSDKETATKTINGNNAIRKHFNSYYQYKNYQEKNDDIYENNVLPEIQYLVENYHQVDDEEIPVPDLKKFALDIEVNSADGSFPLPKDAKHSITLISLYDIDTDKVFIFGEKEWTSSTLEEDAVYYHCPNEKDLLNEFIAFFRQESPDIVTGWNISYNKKMNISGFDFPYIVNRCKNLSVDYTKLSPIDKVTCIEREGNFIIDIVGVALIDYMAAYKWYSRNRPESYSLNFVSNLELGEGKLDHSEYSSLRALYQENWDLYVDYNIIDCKRIKQLEEKLSYLKLIQNLSLITRCPMKHFQAMTSLLEGRMLTYYRRSGLCAPKMVNYERSPFPAAYIKDPHKGLHSWTFAVDIASSYPSGIITLNMSLETYLGKIVSLTEDEIVRYTSQREFPEFELSNFYDGSVKKVTGRKLEIFNLSLQKGYICIAPSGTCFSTKKEGVIAHEERAMFYMRKTAKNKMREKRDRITEIKNTLQEKVDKGLEEELDKLQGEVDYYSTLEQSLKVLINSFYGILAYPYGNRYVNIDIAMGVTACGRHSISQGEKYANEILNNPSPKLNKILYTLKKL